jgi:hypothetical protein
MQTSLNKVVNLLQEIATSNALLNGNFTFCDVADLGASAPLSYPLLWGDVRPSNFGSKVFSLNLQLTAIDIVLKDLSNERDVLSDTLQIISDVIAKIKQSTYYGSYFEMQENISCTPIKDSYGDEVAGWVCNFTLNIANPYNSCLIPTN